MSQPGVPAAEVIAYIEAHERRIQRIKGCQCEPCPGRGNDGHGITHCAECCFGSRVIAEIDCAVHGSEATDA